MEYNLTNEDLRNFAGKSVDILIAKDFYGPGLPLIDITRQGEANKFTTEMLQRGITQINVNPSIKSGIAGATISVGQLVAYLNDVLVPYNASLSTHVGLFEGIASSTGNTGDNVSYKREGTIVFTGYNLIKGQFYFAGPNGSLVRNVTNLAFSQIIGLAINNHTIEIRKETTYIL